MTVAGGSVKIFFCFFSIAVMHSASSDIVAQKKKNVLLTYSNACLLMKML